MNGKLSKIQTIVHTLECEGKFRCYWDHYLSEFSYWCYPLIWRIKNSSKCSEWIEFYAGQLVVLVPSLYYCSYACNAWKIGITKLRHFIGHLRFRTLQGESIHVLRIVFQSPHDSSNLNNNHKLNFQFYLSTNHDRPNCLYIVCIVYYVHLLLKLKCQSIFRRTNKIPKYTNM